ncbi:MAG: ABC transporter ATP-binding protein [Saprospiraceae bacterium]|nr:ABC transporter ATP-binding protein [Saprospiraceae bacterium]
MTTTLLQFQELVLGYSAQKPVHNNPFSAGFHAGQFLAILGKNGTGKSTLLKTIGKQTLPLHGHIHIENKNYNQLSPKSLAKKISVVDNSHFTVPYLKVKDLIQMGRYPYLNFWGKFNQSDQQITQQIIHLLKIEHLQDKLLQNCSDGERQLCLLARALAQNTPIILLDEVTAHLDFENRLHIFKLLKQLALQQQKLIFMVTHEIEMALNAANHFLVFQDTELKSYSKEELIDKKRLTSFLNLNTSFSFDRQKQRFICEYE